MRPTPHHRAPTGPNWVRSSLSPDVPQSEDLSASLDPDFEATLEGARPEQVFVVGREQAGLGTDTEERPTLLAAHRRWVARKRDPQADSLPPIPDEPVRLALVADRSAERSASESVAGPLDAPSEEASTGLFASWEWDEADPLSVPPGTSVPRAAPAEEAKPRAADAPLPPRRAVLDTPTQERKPPPARKKARAVGPAPQPAVVADSEVHGYRHVRSLPPASEPRPHRDEITVWPPPVLRPGIDYPPDWERSGAFDTAIVYDPARPRRSALSVVLLDALAWVLGWVSMFLAGLVTTGSAALVLFALSLGPR